MALARRLVIGGAAALIAAGAVWAFRPAPVAVDLVPVRRGPMEVTVAAEGVTRVREPFLVTAPIGGTAARSPVEAGDPVRQGETLVALIEPAEPALLDARARAQAEAAVAEAEAAVTLAEANVARAEADLAFAESQHARNRELAARGVIAQRMLEESARAVAVQRTALAAAHSELEMHRATLARARAQLLGPSVAPERGPSPCCVRILAPKTGTVLSVANPSARLVAPGETLLTIGDLADLEVEVDLLSTDAVRVTPGARASVERWGGEGVLSARVRRVEPAAFTRVSALGIEEQRVRVRLDFTGPPEERPGLGERFRVFVRIVLWEGAEVLQLPISALFRLGSDWAVYRVVDGRAVATPVTIGNRTESAAELLSGLAEGDVVVAYPGDRVADGVRVAPRTP